MMLTATSYIRINDGIITKNGDPLLHLSPSAISPEDAYRALNVAWLKFFKMDKLSKWAFIGAESLLQRDSGFLYDSANKEEIAVVLATRNGCLDADKRYQQSMSEIPSPALFVYTLPNIMLGEICIRHGFKGEQLCLVQQDFDATDIHFWAMDLLTNRGMNHCLCGWVEATEKSTDVCLFWMSRSDKNTITAAQMQQIYTAGKQ